MQLFAVPFHHFTTPDLPSGFPYTQLCHEYAQVQHGAPVTWFQARLTVGFIRDVAILLDITYYNWANKPTYISEPAKFAGNLPRFVTPLSK